MKKLNCWQVMKCGREPNGKNVEKLGACPASIELRADSIHCGSNAGRCCWAIAGTLCGGEVQGTFAHKVGGCKECEFYKQVCSEEGNTLKKPHEVVEIIKNNKIL